MVFFPGILAILNAALMLKCRHNCVRKQGLLVDPFLIRNNLFLNKSNLKKKILQSLTKFISLKEKILDQFITTSASNLMLPLVRKRCHIIVINLKCVFSCTDQSLYIYFSFSVACPDFCTKSEVACLPSCPPSCC